MAKYHKLFHVTISSFYGKQHNILKGRGVSWAFNTTHRENKQFCNMIQYFQIIFRILSPNYTTVTYRGMSQSIIEQWVQIVILLILPVMFQFSFVFTNIHFRQGILVFELTFFHEESVIL